MVFTTNKIHLKINDAARKNNVKKLKKYIKKGYSLNICDQPTNWTPLHYASFYGNVEMVKFLIQNGLNVNAKTIGGSTPLQKAVDCNHFEVMKILVENGADRNRMIFSNIYHSEEIEKYLQNPSAIANPMGKNHAMP